jgi:hypothetical protein
MDNGTKDSLTLIRMPRGGFVVTDGHNEPGYMRQDHFASTSIDEALKFMRDAILPIGPTAGL